MSVIGMLQQLRSGRALALWPSAITSHQDVTYFTDAAPPFLLRGSGMGTAAKQRFVARIGILALILGSCFASRAWAQQQKVSKPLAGYTAILVEPFTVENSQLTKDFPAGEEANLQLSAIVRLRASGIFETVIDGSQKAPEPPPSSDPSVKSGPRKVILSVTVIGFGKGSSGARFMTWPLPVGVSKAKAHFVFRDAANNQDVFSFEKEAKFQATASGGIATKEEQMSHIKGGLVDALVKEIQHNR
jgi:hypothetical protein